MERSEVGVSSAGTRRPCLTHPITAPWPAGRWPHPVRRRHRPGRGQGQGEDPLRRRRPRQRVCIPRSQHRWALGGKEGMRLPGAPGQRCTRSAPAARCGFMPAPTPRCTPGNNTYKAVQQATGAIAMGPVMQVRRLRPGGARRPPCSASRPPAAPERPPLAPPHRFGPSLPLPPPGPVQARQRPVPRLHGARHRRHHLRHKRAGDAGQGACAEARGAARGGRGGRHCCRARRVSGAAAALACPPSLG
jgi:hypothetical protein